MGASGWGEMRGRLGVGALVERGRDAWVLIGWTGDPSAWRVEARTCLPDGMGRATSTRPAAAAAHMLLLTFATQSPRRKAPLGRRQSEPKWCARVALTSAMGSLWRPWKRTAVVVAAGVTGYDEDRQGHVHS